MKPFIKSIIKKYLQKRGIHVQHFPTPKQVYTSLIDKPASVKEHELRRITMFVSDAQNHTFYEKLLKAFIPDWQPDITKATFIGKGRSSSSLNSYRKVRIGDKRYFEKVYFNSQHHLQTVRWFQDHIYEFIKDEINTPRIQKMYSGELLTVVYYDYYDLKELENETKENRLIQFSRDLYRISYKHKARLTDLELPEFITDYRNHSLYRRRIHSAEAKLLEQGIDRKALEKSLDHSSFVLTHGDIYKNGFKDGALVDWDYFGLFPIGFEPAFIYSRLPLRNSKKCDVQNWLKGHYSSVVPQEDWNNFERNFSYFLFVLSLKFEEYKHIERQLIEKLKQYIITK